MRYVMLVILMCCLTAPCFGDNTHRPQSKAEINKLMKKMTARNGVMLRRFGYSSYVQNGNNWNNYGGVGYRPIITTLPEGINMGASVVVSADRRYVRITCRPMFSSIGAVRTFSYRVR